MSSLRICLGSLSLGPPHCHAVMQHQVHACEMWSLNQMWSLNHADSCVKYVHIVGCLYHNFITWCEALHRKLFQYRWRKMVVYMELGLLRVRVQHPLFCDLGGKDEGHHSNKSVPTIEIQTLPQIVYIMLMVILHILDLGQKLTYLVLYKCITKRNVRKCIVCVREGGRERDCFWAPAFSGNGFFNFHNCKHAFIFKPPYEISSL